MCFVDNIAYQDGGGIDAYESNSFIVGESTFSSKFVLERLHISTSSSYVGHLFDYNTLCRQYLSTLRRSNVCIQR